MMLRLPRKTEQVVLITFLMLATVRPLAASEFDALAISQNIQRLHMPYGTILDPVFASSDPASPGYSQIVSYTRAGDSALWTGHYLAAEAFRYRVTRSPEAFTNAWRAVRGIHALLEITGSGVLARCLVPVDSPYAMGIQQEESGHGIYYNRLRDRDYFWIGNTSRDQYSGIMFGLGVAYDMIDDPDMRNLIRIDVTALLNYLLLHSWNVVMPDGRISTTFLHRPDQMLSFLQVGRRVNSQRFAWIYAVYRSVYASSVVLPVYLDNIDDHNSYFKFNLNYINLYNLIRLEEDNSPSRQLYMGAYDMLRQRTQLHGNAHFNLIDGDLNGANSGRDMETIMLLELWLQRPSRDYWVDLRGKYATCGTDRACNPIPVNERVNTDFLWQRSPFLLFGGGFGTRETAAIDYILPYWMARRHGLTP
ncbi:MAG TPA: hypothetical protein VE422_19980 [Terriglobia bacterium]|nr:hypothetical protein [Terriglobia bacterium]